MEKLLRNTPTILGVITAWFGGKAEKEKIFMSFADYHKVKFGSLLFIFQMKKSGSILKQGGDR